MSDIRMDKRPSDQAQLTNAIATVERMAVVAMQTGQTKKAEALYAKWGQLMQPRVCEALQQISHAEDEIVFALQHPASGCPDALKYAQESRQRAVGFLAKHAQWLATELTKGWFGAEAVKNGAVKAVKAVRVEQEKEVG